MSLPAGRVGVNRKCVDSNGNIKTGGGSEVPIATPTKVGGVKPVAKTENMTKEVGVDADGKLFVEPSEGGGGAEAYTDVNDFFDGYILGNLSGDTIASGSNRIYYKEVNGSDEHLIDACVNILTRNVNYNNTYAIGDSIEVDSPVASRSDGVIGAKRLIGGGWFGINKKYLLYTISASGDLASLYVDDFRGFILER